MTKTPDFSANGRGIEFLEWLIKQDAMIETLRTEYAKINRVDPCGEAYAKLAKLLSALSQDDLKMLAKANIRWVSSLALNRIK